MQIGEWNGHTFGVSAQRIHSFSDLKLHGSCETEELETENQKYVTRKSGKPTEITCSIILNKMLGCEPRTEALAFTDAARLGEQDYFYLNGSKLVASPLMLVDATAEETIFDPRGEMVQCKMSLTFKQAAKVDSENSGSTNTGGASGSGNAVKSVLTGDASAAVKKVGNLVTGAVTTVKTAITNVIASKWPNLNSTDSSTDSSTEEKKSAQQYITDNAKKAAAESAKQLAKKQEESKLSFVAVPGTSRITVTHKD